MYVSCYPAKCRLFLLIFIFNKVNNVVQILQGNKSGFITGLSSLKPNRHWAQAKHKNIIWPKLCCLSLPMWRIQHWTACSSIPDGSKCGLLASGPGWFAGLSLHSVAYVRRPLTTAICYDGPSEPASIGPS